MMTTRCLTRSSRRTDARDDVSATCCRRLSRGHTMTSYLLLAVVTCHVVNVTSLTMLTPGQILVLNAGDDTRLDCHFRADHYSLFDNPLVWRKTQRHEDTILNTMGNVNEPFIATGRFQVTWTPLPPQYRLELSIDDVRLEDSGNYTCEIRGPQSNVLGHVTHYIYVRTPVDEMYLTSQNDTTPSSSSSISASSAAGFRPVSPTSVITYTEGHPGILRCVTAGGYPTPELYVYVGGRELTSEMDVQQAARLTGVMGMRLMRFTTERRSNRMLFTADEDGKVVKCIASIPGLPPNITSLVVSVQHAPKVTCEQTTARPGDKTVSLKCNVKAKPQVAALFWILGDNRTTVAHGEVAGDYWTVVADRSDGVLETYLYMKKVRPESFRVFSIVAENSVGTTTASVELVRLKTSSHRHDFSPPSSSGGGGDYLSVRGSSSSRDREDGEMQDQGDVAVAAAEASSSSAASASSLHYAWLRHSVNSPTAATVIAACLLTLHSFIAATIS